jgi:hypothetical protein
MKRLIMTIIFIGISIGVTGFCEDKIEPKAEHDQYSVCKTVAELATTIMELRQDGMQIVHIVEAINLKDNIEFNNFIISLIKRAYSVPIFEAHRMKQQTIFDFTNEVYLECITEMNK